MPGIDRSSQVGESKSSCVERRPHVAKTRSRPVDLGNTDGRAGIHSGRIGEEEHSVYVQRVPLVENWQAAWLLLSFCASAHAIFIMRTVRPELGEDFAQRHDAKLMECLGALIRADINNTPRFAQLMAREDWGFEVP